MEDMKQLFWILTISAVGIFFIMVLNQDSSSAVEDPQTIQAEEPQYIRREFKNGNSFEVEVDEELTRDNWDCIGDCSGHEAGYEWAEEQGIDEPWDCGGNSESFVEGCEAYANEY